VSSALDSSELRAARCLGVPSIEGCLPFGALSITHLNEFNPLTLHRTACNSVRPIGHPGAYDRVAGNKAECLLEPVVFLAGESSLNNLIQFALSLDSGQIGKIHCDIVREPLQELRKRGAIP
jgi:hypothetical protein